VILVDHAAEYCPALHPRVKWHDDLVIMIGCSDGLTLIERWNGTAWSIVPSPNPATGIPGDGDMLTSISGTGPGDLRRPGRLGTTLGPHALHATGQPARHCTERITLEPVLTSQNV
jgi:hypothetical protein